MTVQATRGAESLTYNRPRRVLLAEPPNKLFVGFNATVIVEPLGLEYLAGNLLDIVDVRIFDMRVDTTRRWPRLSRSSSPTWSGFGRDTLSTSPP